MKRFFFLMNMLILIIFTGCSFKKENNTKNQEKYIDAYDKIEDGIEVQISKNEVEEKSGNVVEKEAKGDLLNVSVSDRGNIRVSSKEVNCTVLQEVLEGYNHSIESEIAELESVSGKKAFCSVNIQRADCYALSFLTRNCLEDAEKGSVCQSFNTYNFSAETGKEIALEEIVNDMTALSELISKQVQKYYPEENFDWKLAEEVIEEAGYKWTLGYQGITFYFPASVIGGDERSAVAVPVLFAEAPDLFAEECKHTPQAYVFDMDSKNVFFADIDEDGTAEQLQTTYYVNILDDVELVTEVEVTVDGQAVEGSGGTGIYNEYSRSYYVHTASGDNFVLVYTEGAQDNSGAYMSFAVSEKSSDGWDDCYIYLADERITDPYHVNVIVSMDPIMNGMTSLEAVYTINSNGFLAEAENTIYSYPSNTICEVMVDMNVLTCQEQVTLSKGEKVTLLRTDGHTWCEMLTEDGRLARVEFDETVELDEYAKVNGQSAFEWCP